MISVDFQLSRCSFPPVTSGTIWQQSAWLGHLAYLGSMINFSLSGSRILMPCYDGSIPILGGKHLRLNLYEKPKNYLRKCFPPTSRLKSALILADGRSVAGKKCCWEKLDIFLSEKILRWWLVNLYKLYRFFRYWLYVVLYNQKIVRVSGITRPASLQFSKTFISGI